MVNYATNDCGGYKNAPLHLSCFREHNWLMSPAVAPLDSPHFGPMAMLPRGHSQPAIMHSEGAKLCPFQQDRGPPLRHFAARTSHWQGWTFLRSTRHSKAAHSPSFLLFHTEPGLHLGLQTFPAYPCTFPKKPLYRSNPGLVPASQQTWTNAVALVIDKS